ncbi:iron ABC transporter permease [Vibrio azureus]|uniref:Putative hemin ABC transporter permease protein n=1 Tax=Vibrio azureus NBRC 104587 TaxID=1219077 RepID=U3ANB4_9VIBR|nr:iron ABC transporter permease [Vibrio azureus]AUI87823.1 iron ABC transporter permease [Vibrio azureus]GAD74782.1 putative hemin ABC transporter permease protein [Vibrio azureus NBRC 104587]
MPLKRLPLSTTLSVLCLLLLTAMVASITIGPMDISFIDSLRSLIGYDTDLAPNIQLIINEIRLPRTLLSLLIGASLAVCGVVMQGVFRNPLAEPSVIGVSAGALLGGALAIVVFADLSQHFPLFMDLLTLPFFAFVGGALTTVLAYKIGTNQFGTSVTSMLLAGIAITALSGAVIGYLNFVANDQMLRDLAMWSMGSLAGANWSGVGLAAVILCVLLFYFSRDAQPLNALLLGDSEAQHLGIDVQKLKRRMILLSAAGVGVSVSLCGIIGFIGLVIPHLGRMLTGPDHRTLLPVSAFLGALLLTLADMSSRVIVAPAELPVGIITALFGSPFFIYLLYKQKEKAL